jgi:3-hydroxyacyl-[acyl-carrier-protein] dehydratase
VEEASLSLALAALPHGPAFRFIDRLTELDPGRSGRGEYRVRGDEAFLNGHFPGNPLMPGVLLVEAAAQLAGVVAQSDPSIPPLAALKLTALRQVKILGSARPGQVVEIQARIEGRMGGLIQASAEARVQGVLVIQAAVTLSGEVPPGPVA